MLPTIMSRTIAAAGLICYPRLACMLVAFTGFTATAVGDPPADKDDRPSFTLRGQRYEVYPAELLRARGIESPDIPPEENAATVYLEAYNAQVPLPDELSDAQSAALQGGWPRDESGGKLAEWLARNSDAIALARRAAEMSQCAMPLGRNPGTDALHSILLPTLSEHRQLAKLLAVNAAYEASRGDGAAAVRDAVVIRRMANHCAGGFTLIEHLVGVAVRDLSSKTIQQVAAADGISADALQSFVRESEALDAAFPTWERAVRHEQVFSTSAMGDYFENISLFGMGGPVGQIKPEDRTGWSRLGRRLSRLFLPDKSSRRNLERFYQQVLESAVPAGGGQPARLGISSEEAMKAVPAWDGFTRIILPSIDGAFAAQQRGNSNAMRARLTAAVEAYRRTRGAAPATLSALVPEFIAAVPIDPATGSEFVYRAGGDKTGLELIERAPRANAPALGSNSATDTVVPTTPTEWQAYVNGFCERHGLTAAQRASAQAILAGVEKRAARLRGGSNERLARLQEQLARTADAAERKQLAEKIAAETKPTTELFDELKRRLNALLTEKQRLVE